MQEVSDDIQFDAAAAVEPATATTTALAITTSIKEVQDSIAEFDKISAGLADLRTAYPVDLVYDVASKKGMLEAIEHRAAYREPRLAVERLRKNAKAPVLKLGKNIDARAAWLTEELRGGETPVDEQIKAEERRKEKIKQDAIDAENARVMGIEDAIAEIHMDVMIVSSKGSEAIAAALAELRDRVLDPKVFQERMSQAEVARTAGVTKLDLAHKAALHTESVQRQAAADADELAELRKVKAQAEADAAELAQLRKDKAEAEQKRLDALKPAAVVAAAPEPVEAPAPAPAPAVRAAAYEPHFAPLPVIETAAEAPAEPQVGTLNAGAICNRLGFSMQVSFIQTELGIAAATVTPRLSLWTEAQYLLICDRLAAHALKCKAKGA